MNILSIGNESSQDAHSYLNGFSEDIELLNLYIKGASLEQHAFNIFYNKPYYSFQFNGNCDNCTQGSIQEALKLKTWDVITLQQSIELSGIKESYSPFLNRLVDRIRIVCPNAEIILHKTEGCDGITYQRLSKTYDFAAAEVGISKLIPVGDVIDSLKNSSEFNILSYDYIRYAASATWAEYLKIADIDKSLIIPQNTTPEKIKLINKKVKEICK